MKYPHDYMDLQTDGETENMRNKGSKDSRPRYSSNIQMQARAKKLADAIDKFIDQAYSQYHFNKLTDFNKLHEVKDHLNELSKLKME